MSEAGLAKSEQTQETSLNGSQMFRISGGYDQLFQGFVHSLPPDENILRLQTLVKKITWRSGHVRIEAQTNTGIPLPAFLAKAVVVTVPLGVLKAPKAAKAAIEWDPFPKELQNALEGMRMGEVQRFIFHFRNRFWEELSEKPIGFLHAGPDKYFPTWWTVMPMRAPLLTAWQGGPKATEMSLWSEEERVKTALMTLSEITGRSITYLSEQLQGWMTHNWSRDPFFLGAYSYITVGGAKAVQRLTRPFEDTLYFAGEATAPDRHRGTVHGALDSGLKAAQKILQLGFSHSETPRSRTTE